jgi:predicted dehydrogenase
MGKPLRVGIISASWGARAHLPAWRAVDGVEVTAICTSRQATAEAAAQDFGIERAFWDFRAMAADPEIDLIDCGTRPPLRYEMVKAALSEGKHVYQGIPFAHTLAAARELKVLSDEAGTVAAVDAFAQAVPAMVRMKELLDEGAIGDPQGFRVIFDMPLFTAARVNVPDYLWFADARNGASAMRNNGSHALHLLVHLLGPVDRIVSDQSIRLKRWVSEEGTITPQVPDTAFSIVRLASGLSGIIETIWSMVDGPGFRIDIWGERGRLAASAPVFPHGQTTRLFQSRPGTLGELDEHEIEVPETLKTLPGVSVHADDPRPGVFPMASIFSSMIHAIEEGTDPAPNFGQALHVHEAIEAAETSAREGRWIAIGDL